MQLILDFTGVMEEQLNTIGDDAQLANIDLQNNLQKQQQTISMLSTISKMLHDTAMAVVRKMSNGGSDSSGSSESSIDESGETEDSQFEAEAAALVDAALAGEVPADVKAIIQDVLLESNQDLEDITDKVNTYNEMENSIREEVSILQDELSDWPDGEMREITYTSWEKNSDGSYVKREKTVTLTKDEAEALLNGMENLLTAVDSQANSEGTESGYSYEMMEGRILVGEAEVIEPTGNAIEDDEEDGENDEDEDDEGPAPTDPPELTESPPVTSGGSGPTGG